ncbi:hypothetical protein MHBO_002440 [Bonamia ostreae]|uniref:Uncharacterized protein n=1 Tax=Bonamia ostreae TaxID=126728 RepID=A0ABV2AMA2_9EUKA
MCESSLKHQRELLNGLSMAWSDSETSRSAVDKLLRCLHSVKLLDYEGFSEWRHWLPSAGIDPRLSSARRKVMLAATNFLDVDLELLHERFIARQKEEWSESEYSDFSGEEKSDFDEDQ